MVILQEMILIATPEERKALSQQACLVFFNDSQMVSKIMNDFILFSPSPKPSAPYQTLLLLMQVFK